MPLHRVIMMQVRKLRPSKRNARTHSNKQIRQVANSILKFSWTYPILVDEDCYIICGHRGIFVGADRREKLIACLDLFVDAGWPAARRLLYRLPELL